LINPLIVKSSNKDVKLLAGCCLIHILRILAPMSNYKKDELKLIFELLAMQIQRLNKNDTEEVDKVEWIIANMAELNICMELINAEL
jgi:hypothetical protein